MTADNWVESMDSYHTLAKTGKLAGGRLAWRHTPHPGGLGAVQLLHARGSVCAPTRDGGKGGGAQVVCNVHAAVAI